MSNLLPAHEKKILARIRFARLITAASAALFIAIVVALLLLLPVSHMIRSHYSVAEGTLTHYAREGSLVSDADIDALTHTLAPLSQKLATPSITTPTDRMLRLSSLIPSTISVNEYSVNDAQKPVIVLSGVATTRSALQSFVETLQKSDTITAVDSPVENYVKNNDPSFIITVTFKS